MIFRLPALLALAVALSGCFVPSTPTQSKPVCSWDSALPANAPVICSAVFRTLKAVTAAEQSGSSAPLNSLIASPRVRQTVTAYGRSLRAQGVSGLHIVPSFTLTQLKTGYVGAGFYLLGSVRGGRVNDPLTLELRVRGTRAVIINDQPGQQW